MQETPEQQTQQVQQAPDQAKVLAMASQLEKERLTGIGGWLIVFIVLMILGMLGSLFNLFQDNPYMPGGVNGLITFRALLSLVLGAIVLVLLFGRKAIFPKLVKIYLLLECALGVIFTIMVYSALSSAFGGMAEIGGMMFVSVIVTVAINLAWFAYFGKSKRVQYTFTQ